MIGFSVILLLFSQDAKEHFFCWCWVKALPSSVLKTSIWLVQRRGDKSTSLHFVVSKKNSIFVQILIHVMETTIRYMPVGIQDFEKLRTEKCAYVDKTQYVYALTRTSKPYFLARPRRFGKSLFISTLKAYFLGKKELFEGLYIAEVEKDWITYPVIYIDFNLGDCNDLPAVKIALSAIFDRYESQWGITEKSDNMSVRFLTLIDTAYTKSGKKVVVLVDEYDRALINTMDESEKNEELRVFLKGFYGVLKGMDYALRFVFLTGVTKFSKVSVFSDLNQLKDISLETKFAGICGISESELLQNFQPEIQALADKRRLTFDATVAELKKRYDGYLFAQEGENMYNPFSLLNVFDSMDFGYYWFKTGTPTFLVKSLKKSNYDFRKFENDVTIAVSAIDDYRAEGTSLEPLLYQSGYLTIKSYIEKYDEFTLGFPNEEVKYGFLNHLLPVYTPQVIHDNSFSASHFIRALDRSNVEDFMVLLKAFYASIPYDLEENRDKDEKYYQLIFYLLFTLMGQFIETEVKSATGRADAIVKTADSIYVFEFKMDEHATAVDALAQIDDKGYLIPYTADNRRLVKIGVAFSIRSKGVKEWIIEG